jgi:uncharacterized protein YneF (UPF0154 family)
MGKNMLFSLGVFLGLLAGLALGHFLVRNFLMLDAF